METQVNIRLDSGGQRKIAVIKELRSAYGFALIEAKGWVDKAPILLPSLGPGMGGKTIKALRDAGAVITVIAPTTLDKMAAASFIQSAADAIGDGDLDEVREALRAALALVGDV